MHGVSDMHPLNIFMAEQGVSGEESCVDLSHASILP
jgi:hypothetical protein